MRLEFRILWFENQPQDVAAQIEEIEDHVGRTGFIPQVRMEVDASNLDEIADQQRRFNDYDLVVVDYDLGDPGRNGDHVAEVIRRSFGFTDIVFYSGKVPGELRRMVFDLKIDGVYCVSRDGLVDKLAIHIDEVVRRMSRLEAMRGLSMGTVAKCDDVLRMLLLDVHRAAMPAEQDAWARMLDDLVAAAADRSSRSYNQCETFTAKIDSRAVTSFHLQKLALAILKGNAPCADQRKLLCSYDAEVLGPRNTLGHAVEARGPDGWEVTSRGNPPIGNDRFPGLRRDLARHLANLESLGPLLADQRRA